MSNSLKSSHYTSQALIRLVGCTLLSMTLPVSAKWKEITPDVEVILGQRSKHSPIFLQENSVKNIKSVNFNKTIYRRGIFSYSIGSTTIRSTYLFDCKEANYKTSERESGFWQDVKWITPSSDRGSFEWVAYKFLCANHKDPWVMIAENENNEQYYANTGTGYTFISPRYGEVRTWIITKHKVKDISNSWRSGRLPEPKINEIEGENLYQLYVACKRKALAIYDLSDYPKDKEAILTDQNPESVGEYMIQRACGS